MEKKSPFSIGWLNRKRIRAMGGRRGAGRGKSGAFGLWDSFQLVTEPHFAEGLLCEVWIRLQHTRYPEMLRRPSLHTIRRHSLAVSAFMNPRTKPTRRKIPSAKHEVRQSFHVLCLTSHTFFFAFRTVRNAATCYSR